MCSFPVLNFFVEYAEIEEFRDRTVLEIGSKDINGSVRPFIEKFLPPKEYVGIDHECMGHLTCFR